MTVDNSVVPADTGTTIQGSGVDNTQPGGVTRLQNDVQPSAEAVNEFEALLNADSAEENAPQADSAPTAADIEQRMRDTIIREIITKHTTIDL